MIKITTDQINEFVSFISNASIPPVSLYVIPNYITVETSDGLVGFACYAKNENQILVAGGTSDEVRDYVLFGIARAYYRHIEHCLGIVHDENEAEAFADSMMELWTDYKHHQNKFTEMFSKKE